MRDLSSLDGCQRPPLTSNYRIDGAIGSTASPEALGLLFCRSNNLKLKWILSVYTVELSSVANANAGSRRCHLREGIKGTVGLACHCSADSNGAPCSFRIACKGCSLI
jgi:hypothetical protein